MTIPSREILLGTKNRHKIEEISHILKHEPLKLKTLLDFPSIDEAVEDGESYEENAKIKALFYSGRTGYATIADDSGLEIDFLGGEPGIHSARFISSSATFTERSTQILEWMKEVEESRRQARFVCVVACATPLGEIRTFRGELHGRIAWKMSGEFGFGYDPIFFLPEYGKNLAELEPGIKNGISHRARALQAALEFILSLASAS